MITHRISLGSVDDVPPELSIIGPGNGPVVLTLWWCSPDGYQAHGEMLRPHHARELAAVLLAASTSAPIDDVRAEIAGLFSRLDAERSTR